MVAVTATGEVDTFDTRGVINGAVERFPPELYLRSTPLTPASAAVRATAEDRDRGRRGRAQPPACALAHRAFRRSCAPSLRWIRKKPGRRMTSRANRKRPSAPRQPPDDLAHLFITCARLIEIPARYVAGYRLTETTVTPNAMHGWADQPSCRGFGWVGFRPGARLCPGWSDMCASAIGLDSLGASRDAPAPRWAANGAP